MTRAKRAKRPVDPPATGTRGETMCAWIKARLAEGQTVYVQTPLRTIAIKPKHADLVRVHNGNCQVSRGKSWDIIDWTRVSARAENPRMKNAGSPLPSDWPSQLAMHVRDEALIYASNLRGQFPDPSVLREQAVERIVDAIASYTEVQAPDSWWERWDAGQIDTEIDAALLYYAGQALEAVETNPALPPFEPVEVEQIRGEMQEAIGIVAERHGLRIQYSELAPNEKTIPIGFKIYRRAPEQRDLFGNPSPSPSAQKRKIFVVTGSDEEATRAMPRMSWKNAVDEANRRADAGEPVRIWEDAVDREKAYWAWASFDPAIAREHRERFGNPGSRRVREMNPRQSRIGRKISGA